MSIQECHHVSPILHCISILDTRPHWILVILVASMHCYEGLQICWIYEFGSWQLPPLSKWSGKTKGKLPSHWEVYCLTRFKVGVIRLGGNARMYWICWSSSSAAFRTVTRHSYRRDQDVISYKCNHHFFLNMEASRTNVWGFPKDCEPLRH